MSRQTMSTVPLVEVDVIFDPTRTPPILVREEVILMPPGLSLLQFNLVGDASFLTYPVQWIDDEFALDFPPPFMRVTRLDSTTVIVTADNRSERGQAKVYNYALQVFSFGVFYSTDPTIINVSPGSGG